MFVYTWVALVQPRTQLEWREQVYLDEYRCSVAVFVWDCDCGRRERESVWIRGIPLQTDRGRKEMGVHPSFRAFSSSLLSPIVMYSSGCLDWKMCLMLAWRPWASSDMDSRRALCAHWKWDANIWRGGCENNKGFFNSPTIVRVKAMVCLLYFQPHQIIKSSSKFGNSWIKFHRKTAKPSRTKVPAILFIWGIYR